MVNDQEFRKQFGNIGIDRESVMNANKVSNTSAPQKEEDEPQELMILKRKFEYFQNSIVKKFEEKFAEIEKKIEEKKNYNVDYNRDMTAIKNDISELQRKIKSIRVSFDGESAPVTSAPATSTASQSSTPVQQSPGQGNGNPGNIKVEDYFNFSNKKF